MVLTHLRDGGMGVPAVGMFNIKDMAAGIIGFHYMIISGGGHDMGGRFVQKVGQIGTKWDTYGTF